MFYLTKTNNLKHIKATPDKMVKFDKVWSINI